jgi:hypothetical protein
MKTFRSFLRLATLLALALPVLLLAQDNGKLNLVFTGSGSVTANQTSFENRYNFKTKRYQNGISTTTGKKPFSGSGYIEIYQGTARIKLPRPMMPLLSGDNDGWFAVNDFFMNDREITGTVRINALNKPTLRIDRSTGIITINGGFCDLTGQCDLVENDPAKRRF